MNEYMLERAVNDAYEAETRFNPETLEYEHISDGPFDDINWKPERFIIDSDKKADWAIDKIKEEQENTNRLRQIAASKIKELECRIKELDERTERRTGNLKALLMDYMQTVKPTKQTKTQTQYELLSGKLVWKKQQPMYERDEGALLAWAETTAPELVKVKKEVSWADLKKQADVSGDKLMLDGEIIPGVTVIERPDAFEVQA